MNPRLPLPLLALALATTASAQSVVFNLESIGGPDASAITFTPVSSTALNISFTPDSAGADFTLSGATPANLDNVQGSVSGTFAATGIQTVAPGVQEATVATSSPHLLTLSDGLGNTETANLWWNTVQTIFSTGGIESLDISSNLAPDLSHFSYSGAAGSALQQDFAGVTSGTATIAFSFAAAPGSLSALAQASSPTTDSFQGQVSLIPEPGTYAAALGALALLGTLARRRFSAVHSG